MKTLKFFSVVFVIFVTVGLSQSFAQVVKEENVSWTGCIYAPCANGGQGEEICGTVYQDFVWHFDKNGNVVRINGKYDHSENWIGQVSGEVFTLLGAIKLDWKKGDVFDWNETLIWKGDKGTTIVGRGHWTWDNVNNTLKKDISFFHCVD